MVCDVNGPSAMVGAESVRDAMELAEHAKSVSNTHPNVIVAIAAQPPSFFRPGSIEDLVVWPNDFDCLQ